MAVSVLQHYILDGGLRAFIGTHPEKSFKSLGLDANALGEQCANDILTTFWQFVSPDCMLRKFAFRVLCAKPALIAVERLWSAYGDNITAKKRSVENDSSCELVYVKMNVHTVHCSLLPHVGNKSSEHVQHQQPDSW
jgi:hypothetical protein